MDIKRLVIYFLIMFVVFTLWNDWVRETTHKQHIVPKAHVPAVVNHKKTSASVAAQPAANMSSVKAQNIHIKTDVVAATINTLGGTVTNMQLLKYPKKLGEKNNPVVLMNDKSKTQYLAQSGLIVGGKNNAMVFKAEKTHYQLQPGQKQLSVTLQWQSSNGLLLTKTFVFKRNDYAIKINYHLQNTGKRIWNGRLYNQLSRKAPAKGSGFLHYGSFSGVAMSTPDEHYQKYKFSNLNSEPINQVVKGGWYALQQHYFISAIVPPQKGSTHFYSKKSSNNLYSVGSTTGNIVLSPGQSYQTQYKLYSGPAEYDRLKVVAPYLNLSVDYGWLWFISIVIFWLMKKIFLLVNNWGWSIVLVTLLIKLIFYRLSASSYRSMGRMRLLQPKIAALKSQYGDDRAKLGQATMEMYKKEKVNPLGGCLPILVQIPVFFALYSVLMESVDLRQAPFIFWIHDLSVRDPYYVLPILMGLSMFLQQRLSPAPQDPTQAKVMMFLPVLLTLMFLHFPAGLVLYWLVNNLVSISQQWYVMKTMDRKPKRRRKNEYKS